MKKKKLKKYQKRINVHTTGQPKENTKETKINIHGMVKVMNANKHSIKPKVMLKSITMVCNALAV